MFDSFKRPLLYPFLFQFCMISSNIVMLSFIILVQLLYGFGVDLMGEKYSLSMLIVSS